MAGTTAATLAIEVVTNATKGTAGLDKAAGKVDKFQSGLSKMAVPAGIAVAAVGGFALAAGKAASDVQQSMGAVDSVFGESAGQVKAWSDTSASAVGLSKSAYGELASTLGASLKNMGIPMDQVAGKTNDLITMGADLAATYGGTTADAVNALGSALRGETDPIEKYGISIKQADIAAQQAKDGTKGLEGEAGKAAKTQALLALATEQAGGAMGQFARETDSAAGSQQIATAQWADAKAALGEALLPVMSAVADKFAAMAGWIKENSTLVGIIVGVIGTLAAIIVVINAAMSVYAAVTAVAAVAQMALFWPILLIVAAIVALIAVIVLVVKKWPEITAAAQRVWAAVRAATAAVVSWFKSIWQAAFAWIKAALSAVGAWFSSVWSGVRAAVAAVANGVKQVWATVFGWVKSALSTVRGAFTSAFNAVRSVVSSVANAVKSAWTSVFAALKSAVSSVGSALSGPFNTVKGAIDSVIGAIRNLISWFGRIKVPKISLPKIPGFNTAPALAAAPTVAANAARVTGTSSSRSAAPAPLTIVIQGAIDPEATARQIRRILSASDRRQGRTGAGLRTSTV